MDTHQKYNLARQLNDVFNNNGEKDFGIMKYNQSTQTYYSDEELAKKHVKQLTKKDTDTVKTIVSLDECMNQFKKHLDAEKEPVRQSKNKWRSNR